MSNQVALLRDMAIAQPHSVAIRTGKDVLSYGGLWRAVCGLADRLIRSGVQSADRVAVLAANGPEPAIAYYAASAIGAVTALLPIDRPKEILAELIDLVMPSAVLLGRTPTRTRFSTETVSILAARVGMSLLEVENESDTNVDVDRGSIGFELEATALPRPHLILFTGGTTGKAKAALHLEDRYALVTRLAVERLGLSRADVLINPYPAHHYGGIQAINQALLVGAELVQLPIPGEVEILSAIEQHRGTFIVAVPTLWRRLLTHPEFAVRDLSCLRMANIASDFVPVGLMREIRARTGAASIQGYGSTEAGLVTLTPLQAGLDKDGTCGLPDEASEVLIVDEAMRALPNGQAGRLRVRSRHMMAGYYQNPKATSEAFDGEWLITGDLAYLDMDGFLVITGREKNIISCGAEKLIPEEIEEALLTHAAVHAAIVMGAPDADMGEVPVAMIQLKPGASVSVDALVERTRERLGWARRIRHAMFIDALPVTNAGKLDRVRAGQLVRQHLDKRARSMPLGGFVGHTACATGSPAEYTAASVEVQQDALASRVAELFSRALKCPLVDMNVSIFDLGADSLTALRLMLEVEAQMGVEIDPDLFLREPTATGLLRLVSAAR